MRHSSGVKIIARYEQDEIKPFADVAYKHPGLIDWFIEELACEVYDNSPDLNDASLLVVQAYRDVHGDVERLIPELEKRGQMDAWATVVEEAMYANPAAEMNHYECVRDEIVETMSNELFGGGEVHPGMMESLKGSNLVFFKSREPYGINGRHEPIDCRRVFSTLDDMCEEQFSDWSLGRRPDGVYEFVTDSLANAPILIGTLSQWASAMNMSNSPLTPLRLGYSDLIEAHERGISLDTVVCKHLVDGGYTECATQLREALEAYDPLPCPSYARLLHISKFVGLQ